MEIHLRTCSLCNSRSFSVENNGGYIVKCKYCGAATSPRPTFVEAASDWNGKHILVSRQRAYDILG